MGGKSGLISASPAERYKVLETLGQGGMGVVQRVHDSWIGREVALKKIRSSTTGLSQEQSLSLWRFHREAAITSSLEHPNIIPLHDIRMDANGDLYFTMRKVEGETLNQLLKKKQDGSQNKEEHQILAIFFKVCDAVAYAHSRGVIHRDLKPDNIMVGKFGEVYVMDWGIAKKLNEQQNIAEAVPRKSTESTVLFTKEVFETIGGIGTPGYMAPEQAENASDVTSQADIYSLGRILRQCYVLMDPYEEFKKLVDFHKDDLETLKQSTAPWEQLVPRDIQAIVEKATKHSPQERYTSVSQLTEDISRYLRYARVSSRKYTLRELLRKWFLRQKKNLIWAGIPLLILGLSFSYFQWLFFYQKEQEIASDRLEVQQALDRRETEESKKMEQLLSAFHLLTRILSLQQKDELSQKQYSQVSHQLIDLACQSRNYALADSIFQSFKSLSSEPLEELVRAEQQIHQARNQVLQEHQKQLAFWKNKLNHSLLDESTLLKAVLEMSQMTEEKMIEKIFQEIQEGTSYFLKSKERSLERIQFYRTLVQTIGEIDNTEVPSFLLKELERMAQDLSKFPQGQVPEEEQSYMVSLAKSLGTSRNSEYAKILECAKTFQQIRFQMGEHSCFWDQTVSSWQKLTQQIKNKNALDLENLKKSNAPEVQDLEEGLLQKKKGALEDAIHAFTQAIQKNSTYAFAYYHRALCFSAQNKQTEALQDLSDALKYNPYFLEAHLEQGLLHKQIRSFGEALRDFNSALKLDPKNSVAYENSGLLKQLHNDWSGSIDDFNEVFQLKKSNFLQSQQFFDLGKSEAEVRFSDFLKQEDVSWLLALGHSYVQNNQSDSALKITEILLQLQPENLDAILLRAQHFEAKGTLDLAIQEYQKVLHLEERHLVALLQCAKIRQKQQEWEKARKDYDRAIEFYPKDFRMYEERGAFLESQNDLEGALNDYHRALGLNDKSISAYLRRGFILQSRGEWPQALADYDSVLKLDTENLEGYTHRGQICFLQKKYQEALESYERALAFSSSEPRNPNSVQILLGRGQTREALKEEEKAFEDYDQALRLNPEAAEAYFCRGALHEKRGTLEKGVSDYEKALQIAPKTAKYATSLGRLFWKQKKFEDAKTLFKNAITLDPNEWEPHYFFGKIYHDEKNLDEALRSYNQAAQLFPSFSPIYVGRGRVKESQGKKEEAIADYEQALKLDRQQGEAIERLSFLKSGAIDVDLDQMIDLYTKNIALTPETADLYLKRGILFHKKGKHKEALEDYNKCLTLNEKLAEGYYWRGVLRQEKSEWKLALEDYEKALKADATLIQVYWSRGKIYQNYEKWEKAKEDFEKALKAEMISVELYESLGAVCWKLNQWKEAIRYYHQASELSPKKAILFLKKGQLLMLIQDWNEAIETLKHAQELDPEFAEIGDALGWAHYHVLGKSPERDHLLWSSPEVKDPILEFWNQAIAKKEAKKEEVPSLFYFHRGFFLTNTGDIEKGLKDLKLAVQKDGNFAEAQNAFGIALYCQGDFEKALKACEKAVSLQPSFSLGYYYQGLIYRAMGPQKNGKVLENYEEAILSHPAFGANYFESFKKGMLQNHLEECNKQLNLGPLIPKNYANLGHILKRMKKTKEALWDFEVFFFLSPEFREYRHPYHTPKLEFNEFTYEGASIYSNGNQSHRIHEYKHKTTQMEFSLVPDGVFFMGSTDDEVSALNAEDPQTDWKSEQMRHFVVLRCFLLAKTEVTVGVWDQQSSPKSKAIFVSSDPDTRKHIKTEVDYPMTVISWEEAKGFCKKYNFTLPSESQWEYACRAGSNTIYPFGGTELLSNYELMKTKLSEYAWYSESSGPENQLHKIKKKKGNGFGLYDMLGNVSEWCEDVCHETYTSEKPFDGSPWEGDKNELHVYRGGYWDSSPRQCRPAYRFLPTQEGGSKRGYYLGFRVCRTIFD